MPDVAARPITRLIFVSNDVARSRGLGCGARAERAAVDAVVGIADVRAGVAFFDARDTDVCFFVRGVVADDVARADVVVGRSLRVGCADTDRDAPLAAPIAIQHAINKNKNPFFLILIKNTTKKTFYRAIKKCTVWCIFQIFMFSMRLGHLGWQHCVPRM